MPAHRRFLGLDLAWSPRNPSGAAILDGAGTLLEARGDLGDDADVVAWVREHAARTTVVGIDMPTIVPNATGVRPCERELARDFRAAHAGPHPANRSRFPDGGRARAILDVLAADGFTETLALPARAAGRFAFEVFPHPAHVRLFGLRTVFKYKKKARPWPDVLAAWADYRRALATLATAEPPLRLPAWIPEAVEARGYKRWDDTLDAITCAYVASYVWHFGTASERVRVYGDLTHGYIVVPNGPANRV